jgi:hypothetical protein
MKKKQLSNSPVLRPPIARRARQAAALLLYLGLSSAAVQPSSADPTAPGGTLVQPRYGHTATRLNDGRVLLVGGEDRLAGNNATCELYDPARNSWKATGSLGQGRVWHKSILLSDGRLLAFGGQDESTNPFSSAELYDASPGTWSVTGSMNLARAFSFDGLLLPDGRVLVAGGFNFSAGGALDSCELYDPGTGVWTPTGNLLEPRYGHHLTLLADGEVLLAGGFNATDLTGDVEVYDPATGTWSASGSLLFPRTNNIQVLLEDGRVLVAGGVGHVVMPTRSSEIYDPATGLWSLTGKLSAGRQGMAANLLPDGRVFVTGGFVTYDYPVNIIEDFDPTVGRWRRLPTTLSSPRWDHTATLLANGSVIVAGGLDDTLNLAPAADLFVRPR